MKCHTCKTEMICIDDVIGATVRIDFIECPKCHSTAEIHYGNSGEYVAKVVWKR